MRKSGKVGTVVFIVFIEDLKSEFLQTARICFTVCILHYNK